MFLKQCAVAAVALADNVVSLSIVSSATSVSCLADDLKHRTMFQNKIAGSCEDMCKEVGSYPNCQCPDFVEPDKTPGVMTWDELLEHMDNLVAWGNDELKSWRAKASLVQTVKYQHLLNSSSCTTQDLARRAQIQNAIAGDCEAMCKEVGAYPKCQCPDFVEPDKTPGVMTWEELLPHMDNLVAWGQDQLKSWRKQASHLQIVKQQTGDDASACAAEDLAHRAKFQNKLASVCEDMCKEIGAYPKCPQCPDFVEPDKTPGVMTWEELLTHMDNLSEWGHGELKSWRQQASQLQVTSASASCAARDMAVREQIQNKLSSVCEEMCKEIGAFPKCQCPDFVKPDSTPGVMTWDELTEHMDNLEAWSSETIKGWHKQASK